jgi:hypothetical protein
MAGFFESEDPIYLVSCHEDFRPINTNSTRFSDLSFVVDTPQALSSRLQMHVSTLLEHSEAKDQGIFRDPDIVYAEILR